MKGALIQYVNDAATNPKVGAAVVAITTGSGISTILEIMPIVLGFAATITGMILSGVLIYTNIKLYIRKMKIMDKELNDDAL